MQFNPHTLRFRLTAVVIAMVLLATSLVAFAALAFAERQMRAIVGEQQIALLSSAAAYIDQDLGAKRALLAAVGEQVSGMGKVSPAALQSAIEHHPSLRDEFFNVIVLDAQGSLAANLRDRRVVGQQNFSKRDYFVNAVKAREGGISPPFKSALSGKPVILVTEPVFDATGKLVWVLGGAIDLQRPRFFGHLESLKSGKTGYLFMLTADGTIVHHPDPARILSNVRQEAGGAVPATLAALSGFEGWTEGVSKRGVLSLLTYKRLNKTDWIIGAVYPVSEAFAPMIAMKKSALFASALVALLSGLIGWLAIRRLLRPMGALQRHVAGITDGSADIAVFDVVRRDEFGELSRGFFLLSKQRKAAEIELAALAHTDPLTGLANRRMFEDRLALAVRKSRRQGKRLGVAFLDIDRFKAINDTHGHDGGDMVLREFGLRLAAAVRPGDTVARLAGDEFVVIFEDVDGEAEVVALGGQILEHIRPAFAIGEQALAVTTSIGIALGNGATATAGQFMTGSDEALYAAKRAGRNACVVKTLAVPEETVQGR